MDMGLGMFVHNARSIDITSVPSYTYVCNGKAALTLGWFTHHVPVELEHSVSYPNK
jgi:hypothetical protein